MAPKKKHSDNLGLSKSYKKKSKRGRPNNKLNLLYKYLGNLCDTKSKRPTKISKRSAPRKKGHKSDFHNELKYEDSRKYNSDYDSRDSSDVEEFDDGVSESSADSSKNKKGEMKVKSYIRKALNLGVQIGYLVPADTTCRVLRVASDLVELENRKRKHQRSHSNDSLGANNEVVDKRRKRRRSKSRRRRRKSRGRRRRRMAQNEESEEMAEDQEDKDSDEDQDDEEGEDVDPNKEKDKKKNAPKTKSTVPDRETKESKKEENSDDEVSDEEQEKNSKE